ncbi:MAG TPA: efflux transporter outer membrane subunit [Bryobacteraceae bacterium]|nr:efflux transporter outer membrane subunit [Bryobacteraceae bacterium]
MKHGIFHIVCAASILSTGCMVGPKYTRPAAVAPPAFKEPPPPDFKEAETQGWKQSQPADAFLKGKWWEIYQDPALNALEEQVAVSNENVQQAEALYREARATVRVSRAALFPTVSVGPSISFAQSGAGNGANSVTSSGVVLSGASTSVRQNYNLPFEVSWAPDLWGAVRRGITGSVDTAQAVAADLENARLLYQSELAEDYFQLHGVDADEALLRQTETSYAEYLTLTKNRFDAGVASDLDVAQAESQLSSTQSALIDLGVQRAQLEHAIAILTGKAPADVTISETPLTALPPAVPVGVPSQLLERRPDIAGAERRVAAANEQIGIAMAAFYPNLTLSGSAGLQNSSLTKWFSWPSRFWSVGPQLAETLFDAGRRRGVVEQQRAAYDATVAAYRQTVLTALQQVEDNLAALRILQAEAAKVQETVGSAQRELNVSTEQYKAGIQSYLTVITAQATLLAAQRSQVSLLSRRMVASVTLVQALGGGWQDANLPTRQEVTPGAR